MGSSRAGTATATTEPKRSQPDGVVSLDEVVDHVLRKVPELTLVDDDAETAQHPTVSPVAIVPYITLPLTELAKPAG